MPAVKSRKRRVRLKDVAEQARVSVAAVSMALADHPDISPTTKQRVVEISRALGYRSPHSRHSDGRVMMSAGVMIVGSRVDEPSYAGLLHHLAMHSQSLGVGLQLAAVESRDPADALGPAMTLATHTRGILLVGYVSPDLAVSLSGRGKPVVVIGHLMASPDTATPAQIPEVAPDEVEMGRQATAWLLRQGHRRIAFICEVLPPGLSHSRWLNGYRLAHLEAGTAIDSTLIHASGIIGGGGEPASAVLSVLPDPPTAVVVPDAPLARSFMDAMSACGRPLDPRAVVIGAPPARAQAFGVGDCPMVYEPQQDLAEAALELLLARIEGSIRQGVSLKLHAGTHRLEG